MRNLLIVIFTFVVNFSFSQDYSELRHIQNDSFSVDFYVSADHKKISHKDTVLYAWYKSKKVMFTQGQSSGNILNGSYKKYYRSGQLAEYGNYKFGLKFGEWKVWNEKGLLVSISNYKKGQLHGKHFNYKNGSLIQADKYSKGQLKVVKEKIERVKTEKEPKLKKDTDQSFFNKLFKKNEESSPKLKEEKEKKRKWFTRKDKTEKDVEENKKTKVSKK